MITHEGEFYDEDESMKNPAPATKRIRDEAAEPVSPSEAEVKKVKLDEAEK